MLVDVSRSMRVADADGDTRIARAAALLRFDLLPALSQQFRTELLAVGDAVEAASIDALTARANQSDLSGALASVRERFRGQRVAGVVRAVGRRRYRLRRRRRARRRRRLALARVRDRRRLRRAGFAIARSSGIAAGDQRLEDASVDLQVSAVEQRVRARSLSSCASWPAGSCSRAAA